MTPLQFFGDDCFYGAERSLYRVLYAHGSAQRCRRTQPPEEPRQILHADNGHPMRASILESRLEALGDLRSLSRKMGWFMPQTYCGLESSLKRFALAWFWSQPCPCHEMKDLFF